MAPKMGPSLVELQRLIAGATLSEEMRVELNLLLTGLRRHDEMSVRAFLDVLARLGGAGEPAPTTNSRPTSKTLAESLRKSFDNDEGFRSELKQLQSDRRVTRELLNELLEELSGRKRKLPSKATKAKLVQDIADYRLEQVRSLRAAEMFGGKPAFAE